jgi:hypothetical protein
MHKRCFCPAFLCITRAGKTNLRSKRRDAVNEKFSCNMKKAVPGEELLSSCYKSYKSWRSYKMLCLASWSI